MFAERSTFQYWDCLEKENRILFFEQSDGQISESEKLPAQNTSGNKQIEEIEKLEKRSPEILRKMKEEIRKNQDLAFIEKWINTLRPEEKVAIEKDIEGATEELFRTQYGDEKIDKLNPVAKKLLFESGDNRDIKNSWKRENLLERAEVSVFTEWFKTFPQERQTEIKTQCRKELIEKGFAYDKATAESRQREILGWCRDKSLVEEAKNWWSKSGKK